MKVINDLLDYKGLKIVQDSNMFSFSLDSVLLANFVRFTKKDKNVIDIGCGNAPIPLILSLKTDAKITGVEIQKEVFDMAIESLKINNLQDRIEIVNEDINDYYKNLESDSFDIITCNPPYFRICEKTKTNDSEFKKIARHEFCLDMGKIAIIAKKILKNNGSIYIVHRTERLSELLQILKINNLIAKRIQFIYPKKGKESNLFLIEATKNGNEGLKVLEPLYIHDDNGNYREEITKIFKA